MIAHILKHSKKKVTAFLGGISSNYNTNLIIGTDKEVVIEADEYDRSFLNLRPDVAVLTSMDADHLDIYEESGELEKTFKAFLALVNPKGTKIVNAKLDVEGCTYSIDQQADFRGVNITIKDGLYHFDLKYKKTIEKGFTCGLPGRHNVENAVAAIAACHKLGLNFDSIREGIASFAGVKRRFEYHVRDNNIVYIDDYAHHPEELRALLDSAKEMYPTKKISLIFQPHLFSRTQDFAQEFAQELSKADHLYLLDIYPAREEPILGVTSDWLLKMVNNENKKLVSKTELNNAVLKDNPEVIITAGAGDIDRCITPLKQALQA